MSIPTNLKAKWAGCVFVFLAALAGCLYEIYSAWTYGVVHARFGHSYSYESDQLAFVSMLSVYIVAALIVAFSAFPLFRICLDEARKLSEK
jgi:hypothetical protein